jgi:hypothetical protein
MLPKDLVLDEVVTPKDFDELIELAETSYRVEHEQTTLESISLRPDGSVQTPAGELQATRDFLEQCSAAIRMPLGYFYEITPELFCSNFNQRQAETTSPITISRVGNVATGLILDRKSRYRPACSAEVLRAIRRFDGLSFRRASVSFAGMDVELVRLGNVVEPVVGDVLEIGFALSNSESGGRQLKAAGYSYRLRCTNGARMSDDLGVARWANDPRMTDAACLLAFQRSLALIASNLESVAILYRATVDRPVPDNELWNAWRRVAHHVSRGEADDVLGISEEQRRDLQQLIRLRGPREPAVTTERNAYEVHNRITHAAHGRNFRIGRGLQELGGEFLSRAATWPPAVSAN